MLLARLGKHAKSGSCLHVKKLADLDKTVLSEIVVKSVAATRKKYVKTVKE
ncbi:MAG: hypothetical protein PT977_04590 [Acidobacteriota bacterium]|nr:hypothetical protein [Acidobacteriota bacterium]